MAQNSTVVLIVGAGPAGLSTSACLNLQNIPNVVLERDDCYASLWRKRAYDRLKLHLAKEFCELPHLPFPPSAPTYVSKNGFIQYLDEYVSHFRVNPLYNRHVVAALFDESDGQWAVTAEDRESGVMEKWVAKFLVVATGENSEGYIPPVPGLETFRGEVMHSSRYENGERFDQKNVLVVGCGNSGMEIALDLSNWGTNTSIVIRGPVHVLSEGLVRLGMVLLRYLPLNIVDNLVLCLSWFKFGNLIGFGIQRPKKGPFYLKKAVGRSPVIDVGTVAKIRANKITVLPGIEEMEGDEVHFTNDVRKRFDAVIFATGYKSTVRKWLEVDGGLFNEEGMPKESGQWKGQNGLYCAGFARTGLFGISKDAKAISQDIGEILGHR